MYSAAATLYYLLTGCYTRNFDKKNRAKIRKQLAEMPATPIRTHCPDLDLRLADIIDKALTSDRGEQVGYFRDVNAFHTALLKYLDSNTEAKPVRENLIK